MLIYLKNVCHISNKNFWSLSETIISEISQSTFWSLFINRFAHWLAKYINFSAIKTTCYENLLITVSRKFNSFKSVMTKLMTIIWKECDNIKININLSYDLWHFICVIWQSKQCFMYCQIFLNRHKI